jgi:hypothetical protein
MAEDAGAGVDLASDSTLVTRAARRMLGLPDYHLVEPPPGYICPDSARELFGVIVELGTPRAAADSSVTPGAYHPEEHGCGA